MTKEQIESVEKQYPNLQTRFVAYCYYHKIPLSKIKTIPNYAEFMGWINSMSSTYKKKTDSYIIQDQDDFSSYIWQNGGLHVKN